RYEVKNPIKIRLRAYFFMSKLYQLIQSEYKTEYIPEYEKPEGLMDKKNYSTPKIYPKIIEEKRLNAFSELEKQQILSKYKRWYVYYYFRNEEGKMVKQPSIFFKINQEHKDFDARYLKIHHLRKIIENLLKNGYTPYQENFTPTIENQDYTAFSALDFALQLKKSSVSEKTYKDYKFRVSKFQKFLKSRYLNDTPIKNITKKEVNEFLNEELIKTSPRNRNNTLVVLNSMFSTLEENELINHNVVAKIKKLQAKPERNKTYSQSQQDEIFALMEQKDKNLLLFVKFISYNFLRPIEVCRLQVKDIDFEGAKLNVRAKNKLVKIKIIPEILLQEIQFIKGQNPDYYLFSPNGIGEWISEESNKRDYWSKRFKKVKDALKLGKDYGLYSFRHTFITKLYRQLRTKYTQGETYDRLMLITGHTTLSALQQYLRDIDAELPEDYSKLLE
ncbi:MAG: site-specific integrase, partial [Capnocytophaga sp.]|nr:site-specific integrase [Capnocytophaga sp.]